MVNLPWFYNIDEDARGTEGLVRKILVSMEEIKCGNIFDKTFRAFMLNFLYSDNRNNYFFREGNDQFIIYWNHSPHDKILSTGNIGIRKDLKESEIAIINLCQDITIRTKIYSKKDLKNAKKIHDKVKKNIEEICGKPIAEYDGRLFYKAVIPD